MNKWKEVIRRLLANIAKVIGAGSAGLFAWYLTFLIKYKLEQARRKLPLAPGPTPFPVVGNLNLVLKEKTDGNGNPLVHHALMKEAKKYNGLFGLWMGAAYTVVISKPSVAEEAFCTHKLESGIQCHGDLTSDRAANQSHGGDHVPSMYIMTRNGKGIAMSCGPYHKKVRGRLVAHITAPKASASFAKLIQEEVESVVSEWRRKALKGEKIDNLTAQLKRESMNMAMRVLFGKRFGAHEPQDFKDLKYCVEYFFCNLSSGNPSDMLPWLRAFPNAFLTEAQKVADLRDEVLTRLIREQREQWDKLRAKGKMSTRSQARSVVDQFFFDQVEGFEVADANGDKKTLFLTDDEIHVCLWDILFAMTDTTATTNEWLVYHMVNHPHIQKKVQAELDRVVGPGRLPTLDDKENLPYFWATVKETMRYRIVSPIMAPHYAVEDITLHDTTGQEFFVPRGTTIYMHGYSMGLDPELWDNPEEFNPDRWFNERNLGLDLHGQVRRKNVEHYKFIPFSLGPRMCPGYSFAKVAQFIQSAVIVGSFNWKLASDARKIAPECIVDGKLDMTEDWGLTIMPRRYGEMGLIEATPRSWAFLCKAQAGDIEFSKTFLQRDVRQKIRLVAKEPLSHDSCLLRFAFPDKTRVLGLPTGKHFKVYMPNLSGLESGKWNGRDDPEATKDQVERAYTPVTGDEEVGYVDLVVKCYRPGQKALFPDGGKVSQQLDRLLINDEIEIAGPFGRIEYCGKSVFKVGSSTIIKRSMVGMLAGGSGITPMFQVLRKALEDPQDQTMFSLIYANQEEGDILVRDKLEAMAAAHPKRFRLHYTLDRAPENWKFSTGFITSDMIKSNMPPASDDTLILLCGPPPMVDFCKTNLAKLGYSKDAQITY